MEIYGAEVYGIQGILIRFGAVIEPGSGLALLGVPNKVVQEGYTRAIKGIELVEGDWNLMNYKITIQMNPPGVVKRSEGLDLPIAIILLLASLKQDTAKLEDQIIKLKQKAEKLGNKKNGEDLRKNLLSQIEQLVNQKEKIIKYKKCLVEDNSKYLIIGSIDITTGNIEPPRYGMLSMLDAADSSFKVIVPEHSNIHAALVMNAKGFKAYKAKDVNEVWNVIIGNTKPREVKFIQAHVKEKKIVKYIEDFREIDGVAKAKEAMTVAIAGGHNILLIGPPGEGKGMLSRAATKLLPSLTQQEIFELNKIYSASGILNENEVIISRPFREVHSQTPPGALFGGGVHPVPGEISLAHKGILLLDEINLFRRETIELLRTPLEDHKISVQRIAGRTEYPCNFILIAAMNPCQDGWYNHFYCPKCGSIYIGKSICKRDNTRLIHKCKCNSNEIRLYKDKLSKALMDRIDLKVLLSSYDESIKTRFEYTSQTLKRKVNAARLLQQRRYLSAEDIYCNADIKNRYQYAQFDTLDTNIKNHFKNGFRKYELSRRQFTRLLLVTRTIADLNESQYMTTEHIDRAILLMGLNNPYFKNF